MHVHARRVVRRNARALLAACELGGGRAKGEIASARQRGKSGEAILKSRSLTITPHARWFSAYSAKNVVREADFFTASLPAPAAPLAPAGASVKKAANTPHSLREGQGEGECGGEAERRTLSTKTHEQRTGAACGLPRRHRRRAHCGWDKRCRTASRQACASAAYCARISVNLLNFKCQIFRKNRLQHARFITRLQNGCQLVYSTMAASSSDKVRR